MNLVVSIQGLPLPVVPTSKSRLRTSAERAVIAAVAVPLPVAVIPKSAKRVGVGTKSPNPPV